MERYPVILDSVRSRFAGVFGERLPLPFAIIAFGVGIAYPPASVPWLVNDNSHAAIRVCFDSNRAIIHSVLSWNRILHTSNDTSPIGNATLRSIHYGIEYSPPYVPLELAVPFVIRPSTLQDFHYGLLSIIHHFPPFVSVCRSAIL